MPPLRALGLGLAICLQLVAAIPLSDRSVAARDCKPSRVTTPLGPTPTLPLTGGMDPSESLLSIQTHLTC
jgi:hypothetical protein